MPSLRRSYRTADNASPITGFCAFTHKAGIHAKAILANPSTYEILNPQDFGLTRYIHIGSRITGWNAVKSRVEQLQLEMTDDQVKVRSCGCVSRLPRTGRHGQDQVVGGRQDAGALGPT